jgi:hypothetical protein
MDTNRAIKPVMAPREVSDMIETAVARADGDHHANPGIERAI